MSKWQNFRKYAYQRGFVRKKCLNRIREKKCVLIDDLCIGRCLGTLARIMQDAKQNMLTTVLFYMSAPCIEHNNYVQQTQNTLG